MKSKKIIILNSHPIQYFVPLYQYLSPRFDIEVLYSSKHGVTPSYDSEFKTTFQWDIPLLDGYKYKFLKNYSISTSNSFFSFLNIGIINELYKAPTGSIIWIHGWQYFSHLLALIVGNILGHKVCLRTETPYKQEILKQKPYLRRLFFKSIFKFVDYFLYIGKQNKLFYKHYGVEDEKLIETPYCVDNQRFIDFFNAQKVNKGKVKESLGISQNQNVLLCIGKLIPKKRPIDLLKAFHLLNSSNLFLIFVGEGELRDELQDEIDKYQLKNVAITGFVNQTQIVNYYLCGDLYIMCSQEGETWGLSTNEAMCFNLPILLSDMVGCSEDLVRSDSGKTYPMGNIEELSKGLSEIIKLFGNKINDCKSQEIVKQYSFEKIAEALTTIIDGKKNFDSM